MLTFTWVLPWNEAFRAGEGEKFPGAFSAHQGHDVVLGHARGVAWGLPRGPRAGSTRSEAPLPRRVGVRRDRNLVEIAMELEQRYFY